jgi:energy-coupling factor transporter ATP-binding protein EcfA2
MFDDFQICPYTGLRSFTEEESIYFKGREENIEQATEQLQKNKFLMLTGASGDGKSSLVYAGIIPNARAGFLKSQYSQWAVADFRPERTPFKNLCKSIAAQLGIGNVETVESELKHGFSALIELYKNSSRYLDTQSEEWIEADESKKAELKRNSANLLILTDQFEEFFTNPENYQNGAPSRESNLVLNLLLETARISYEENLPVYVIFTMRSDFIGQCAAFRGLPEYIGFSQFFVPRLNRTQLQQVVEEPAMLSGNRISRRLTERLIYDLTEGGDQLPILQHALNQIWHAADQGKQEMDLIHYAMVGGMPADELPDNQKTEFKKWFSELPDEIRNCYHEPGLQNVLDTHTNKLYLEASEYYRKNTGKSISHDDVKKIIKTAFTCLTKIDQSRAVRNRMTLHEITDILNRPGLDAETVGTVLNIFREPGNTFIRPFILDNDEDNRLQGSDVLDITHESLIRNWKYLEEWALEEYDNYTVFLDFEKQLNRWLSSDKSNGFLLSIGPLVFFENWYERVQPNKHWIARYLPDELEIDKKLEKAGQILTNTREFLSRSSQKHLVTRKVMQYGTKKIAIMLGILLMVSLGSYIAWDSYQKQNDTILRSIKNETISLANRPNLALQVIVPSLTEQMIMGTLTIPEIIDGIENRDQKIKVATGIASNLVLQGRYEPAEKILQALEIADALLDDLPYEEQNADELSHGLQMIYDFTAASGLVHYYLHNDRSAALVQSNAQRSAVWSLHILLNRPDGFTDIQHLHLAIENSLNQRIFDQNELDQILNILSPFESNERSSWVLENYPRDRTLIRGAQPIYGNRHNGLFQLLAYVYAASGKPQLAIQSVDTILANQASFFENDYTTHVENATNIAGVFYTYDKIDQLDDFAAAYTARINIPVYEFYNRLIARTQFDIYLVDHLNYYTGTERYHGNLNLKFASDEMLSFFFSKIREDIQKTGNPDARNFNLALSHKDEGVMLAFRNDMRQGNLLTSEIQEHFEQAINYYSQTSGDFLRQNITISTASGLDFATYPRNHLFQFPDFRVPFYAGEPRARIFSYNSPMFAEYLIDNELFDQVYTDRESLRYFETWIQDYHAVMSSRDWTSREPMPYESLKKIALRLDEAGAEENTDLNLLYLHLADIEFSQNNPENGIASLRKIRTDRLLNSFQYALPFFINTYSLELTAHAVANAMLHGESELAGNFVNVFQLEVNRSSIYAYASQRLSLRNRNETAAIQLLDSARTEMLRLDNPSVFQPNRLIYATALAYQNPVDNRETAYQTIKNSGNKFSSIFGFSLSDAFFDDLYSATSHIPELVSSSDRLQFYYNILYGANMNRTDETEWKKYRNNEFIFIRRFLPYIPESS